MGATKNILLGVAGLTFTVVTLGTAGLVNNLAKEGGKQVVKEAGKQVVKEVVKTATQQVVIDSRIQALECAAVLMAKRIAV